LGVLEGLVAKSTIIFVGGYARSGKTTVINYLEEHYQAEVLSGSRMIHQITDSLLDYFGLNSFRLKREINKFIAESVLKKFLHPQIFALALAEKVKTSNSPLIVIESIGGDEFVKLKDLINSPTKPLCWNIRKDTEQPQADQRELLPEAFNIWNEGSIDDLFITIQQKLKEDYGSPTDTKRAS